MLSGHKDFFKTVMEECLRDFYCLHGYELVNITQPSVSYNTSFNQI
jgi:hypothetical protein